MQVELLEAFVAVAEEQHFGRAAQRLHIAQSPLSQRIRRLEAQIGVSLFDRTTRRVDLTAGGRALLSRAPALLAAHAEAADGARRAAAGEEGRLAVGFTGSATFALLPPLAAALRRELPRVTLELHGELLTPRQVAGLLDGSLDLGLLRPPVREAELSFEVVRREPLIAALPERHPLAALDAVPVERMTDEPFITYPSQSRSVLHDAVEETCAAHGFAPRTAMEVGETATLVSFVAAGLGVSLVPASVAYLTITGAVYRPLVGQPGAVELAVAWRRDDETPVLRRALQLVRDQLGDASAATADHVEVVDEAPRSRDDAAQARSRSRPSTQRP